MFKLFLCFLIILTYFNKVTKCTSETEWKQHVSTVSKFKCDIPQPRAFRFEEIAENVANVSELNSFQVIIPSVTVLHRCDRQTGVCHRSPQICAPVVLEEARLTFAFVPGPNSEEGSKIEYISVVATNHTSCGCISIRDFIV
ncbi:hypothetical protein ILUMI_17713 [Ignelater luminosus]|uniref:Uncharacterized protein n=1 Tax=Ignelater luminosus TaxID=2038154 RepID=A0A8K0CRR4_IGNLU|nr:hypothetical protein ILUMI_17713 [Ignelater luminosus]